MRLLRVLRVVRVIKLGPLQSGTCKSCIDATKEQKTIANGRDRYALSYALLFNARLFP